MVEIIYVGYMLYLAVTSSVQLFLNPSLARSKGNSRWASRIPNYVLLLLCSTALLFYPFTDFPTLYEIKTTVTRKEQYFITILYTFIFHMLTIGITFIKRTSRLGIPRSFIAHYFKLFIGLKEDKDERDVIDVVLAGEYAVIGAFGSLIGPIILPYGVITTSNVNGSSSLSGLTF